MEAPLDQGSEEPDVNFWAEKAQEFPNDMDDGMGYGDDDMGYGDDDTPFDSNLNQSKKKKTIFTFLYKKTNMKYKKLQQGLEIQVIIRIHSMIQKHPSCTETY